MKATTRIITHEDIQKALRAFRQSGGVIARLPDEIALHKNLVGGNLSAYENDAEAFLIDVGQPAEAVGFQLPGAGQVPGNGDPTGKEAEYGTN